MKEDLKDARILIVDDTLANIEVLENLLMMKGYTNVKSISDSTQAIATIFEFKPELILLDLMMPQVSGFDIMEILKKESDVFTLMRILVLTADITPESKKKALSGGASDFLTKPFDLTEVDLRIKNLLYTVYLMSQLTNQNLILEEKVKERTQELEKNLEAIELQNKALREISWIQSHVVRAPLARMMGAISLLEIKDDAGVTQEEIMEIVITSANEIDKTVREISAKSAQANI
ncbi:response regulator [Sediminibacterium sp.]|uniref:response regulator n=1 Tax=Sediminibacterium sp. TaxID=1917865 RepID=UPI002732F0DD|nr:response regulator [Sediminibacterium sp.]MDP3394745.1 response regulator [Sediminibacterium sp.]MDP3568580.1 response regulator [Sediminibacterium sp.]